MENKNNIIIRKFKYTDIDDVLQLLSIVMNHNFTREWWKWKYELNPNGFFGEDGDIWIAKIDNKIIGHYAVIPETIKINSKIIKIAQSVDTATHPNYRKLGIFTTLANKVYSDVKNRYQFIYGFPSEMAYKSFIRVGWKDFIIPQYIKIINYDELIGGKFKSKFFSWTGKIFIKIINILSYLSTIFSFIEIKGNDLILQEIDAFPVEINDFYIKVKENYKIILERTDTFLNWRFAKQFGYYRIFLARSIPENNIIGYMVLIIRENILSIIDLVTLPNEDKAMIKLVDISIKIAKENKAYCVHCWFPNIQKNIALLKRLSFISLNKIYKISKIYSTRLILYNLTDSGVLPDISEWFYTLADTDAA